VLARDLNQDEALRGRMQLLDSPLGGLRVSVELPVRATGC
jgi:hypothetical protein